MEIVWFRLQRIATGSAEGMPVGNGEPKMLLHGFTPNLFVGIVKLECQRIIRILAFVLNCPNTFEILFLPLITFMILNFNLNNLSSLSTELLIQKWFSISDKLIHVVLADFYLAFRYAIVLIL